LEQGFLKSQVFDEGNGGVGGRDKDYLIVVNKGPLFSYIFRLL